MRTIQVSWALLLGLGLLAGCGGGGGGEAGPAYDLNGWWELGTRNTGSPVPHEVGLILPTRQTGSSVLFNDTSLTLEGSTLRGAKPDAAAPDRTEYAFSVVSSDLLEGEAVTYRGGIPDSSRDVRMLRYPAPSGTFSGSGWIGTGTVSINAFTAYAISNEDPAAPRYQILVMDMQPDGINVLSMNFQATAPLTNATYIYGGTFDGGVMSVDGDSGSVTGGFVTITAASTNGVRGNYDLSFATGSVSGTFDVEILIQN